MSSEIELGHSVLIVDQHEASCASLGRSFRESGAKVWIAADYAAAVATAAASAPDLIVTELRVGSDWALDNIERLKKASPLARLIIATFYPSVATAVRSVRLGFSAYLAKPVTARQLLEVLSTKDEPDPSASGSRAADCDWPSLDRTIWEYLNEVFVEAGTMSEAARRLHLDRRSLRRMLAKYPPAR